MTGTKVEQVTWADVDAALERVESGNTTVEDANLLRAVLDRFRETDCDCATGGSSEDDRDGLAYPHPSKGRLPSTDWFYVYDAKGCIEDRDVKENEAH